MEYPVTPMANTGSWPVMALRESETSEKSREKLVKELMDARRKKDRAGVDKAKRGLGEPGSTWWK